MMKRFYILGFLALIIFDTLAQVSFKFASVHAEPLTMDAAWLVRVFGAPWIYGAFVGYIGAFFTWMTLLKYAPVGPAFAASHLELISVTLISVWLFDDTLTLPKIIGGALIIAGILCWRAAKTKRANRSRSSRHRPRCHDTPMGNSADRRAPFALAGFARLLSRPGRFAGSPILDSKAGAALLRHGGVDHRAAHLAAAHARPHPAHRAGLHLPVGGTGCALLPAVAGGAL